MYMTSPYPPHNSSDISRSLVLYSYGIDISVHRSQTSQFYAYKHGGIYISHSRFSQEAISRGV